jgi:hypothetical protein
VWFYTYKTLKILQNNNTKPIKSKKKKKKLRKVGGYKIYTKICCGPMSNPKRKFKKLHLHEIKNKILKNKLNQGDKRLVC